MSCMYKWSKENERQDIALDRDCQKEKDDIQSQMK